MKNFYDLIIIGAGSAGLSAAIYAARRELKTLVLSKDVGGQANLAHIVENYPGVENLTGPQLLQVFYKQAQSFGVEFAFGEVKQIEKIGEGFAIKTLNNQFEAKALILAFGLTHRHLNVPGEIELTGKGVSYCANCDGPFFKEKTVAVVGGGNSALDAAEYLSKLTKKVYLIHRRDEFRAEEVLQNKVKQTDKIEILYNTEVEKLEGENKLQKAVVVNTQTQEKKELEIDGVFIEIGFELKTDLIEGLIKLDERNHIPVDANAATNEEGIFAAGDCTNVPFKQIVVSAGQGAIAALSAYQYVTKEQGKLMTPDWTK